MKVYTRCLRPDLEYKTMSVKYTTTCRNVVDQLLNKYRMKHRDPNLFFLTMEVATRSTGQWNRPQKPKLSSIYIEYHLALWFLSSRTFFTDDERPLRLTDHDVSRRTFLTVCDFLDTPT